MTPPRNRKDNNEDLAPYPGLGRYADGRYYVVHPVTKKQASLKTRDFKQAVKLWGVLSATWKDVKADLVSQKLLNKLGDLETPKSAGRDIHLCDFLKQWREEILGYKKLPDGSIQLSHCYVIAQRGKGRGKPIAEPTRRDYGADCLQLEAREDAKFPISDRQAVEKIRALLSQWLTKPTHYNGLRNTLTRALSHAVQTGVISRNPMRDIEKVLEPKREVKIPDEAFSAITTRLLTHNINKRVRDGEWRAKICDLFYMFSQQPIDVFGLMESNIHLDEGPFGEIHFARHKTGNVGIIEMNAELRELIEWFQQFKRSQGIISPHLMVYPMYMDSRSKGKPVKHRTVGGWWAEACIECGYTAIDHEGKTVALYQLRDLRKRGLTDEALNAGEATNKGIHSTEQMKNHYVLEEPPKRATNTLQPIKR
ncbi:MAG: hypothetical protein MJA28_06205 [Gammaproteobacteria bacterium]|nr:hypothetical protein [Gammaproteobacteria bacterium]